MGKKDKNKKKGKGAEKTIFKTDKKLEAKQKKMLEELGEADIAEIVLNLEAAEAQRTAVTETIGQPPSPRSSFSLCASLEKDELILFGGEFYNGQTLKVYNDLFIYNIHKNEWKLLKAPGGPGPRSSHQMCSTASDGGQLWLFGGEHASPSQLQFYHYKDLWVYHQHVKKWDKIQADNGPSPRSGHRMVTLKRKLFIFGGFYDSGISYRYFNDLWMFSMDTYSWLEIKPSGAIIPAPRSAACMVNTPDGRILIWGGYSKAKIKKDIDRGSTHNDMFALIPEKNDILSWKWISLKPGGVRPVARNGVSVAVAQNGRAYVFGGVLDTVEDEEDLRGTFSNEIHYLELAGGQLWRQVLLTGVKEKKSRRKKHDGHNTMDMKDNSAEQSESNVSSDGVFTMTVASSNTSTAHSSLKSDNSSNCPSPRMKPGLVVCKGHLYLYGGIYEEENKQHTLADFYSIDLHKMDSWKTIIPPALDHEWVDSESDSDISDDDSDDEDDEDDEDDDDDEDNEDNEDQMDTT